MSEEEPQTDPLTEEERAELARLRRQVDDLQGAPGAPLPSRPPKHRLRTTTATVLIVIACLLAPLSVVAVWARSQVNDTNRYVATVAPLAHNPAVQKAVADDITNEIFADIDVNTLTSEALSALTKTGLPPELANQLQGLSSPIANGVKGFTGSQIEKIVASAAFATAWEQANRAAHQALVTALTGKGNGSVTVKNGTVTLNLGPFIGQVKQRLEAQGFGLASKIPTVNKSFVIFQSKDVSKIQRGYRLLNTLGIWLPILVLLLLGAGILATANRRRGFIAAGLGLAGGMLLLGLALALIRPVYLNAVPADSLPPDAAAAVYDALLKFLRVALRTVLLFGLIVAAGAFFTGPAVAATRTRAGLSHGIGWLRGGAEQAGLRTGPVGTWVYAHKHPLRIAAVIAAALPLAFWAHPGPGGVILLAVLLLVALAVIEFLGRPPERTSPAAPASAE